MTILPKHATPLLANQQSSNEQQTIDQDFIHPELTKAEVSAALETSKHMNKLLLGWIVIFLVVLFTIGMPTKAHAGGSYMTCDYKDGVMSCQSHPDTDSGND